MKEEDARTRATSLQLKINIESRTDVVFLTGSNITQTNPFILTVPALNRPLKHGSCPAHDNLTQLVARHKSSAKDWAWAP